MKFFTVALLLAVAGSAAAARPAPGAAQRRALLGAQFFGGKGQTISINGGGGVIGPVGTVLAVAPAPAAPGSKGKGAAMPQVTMGPLEMKKDKPAPLTITATPEVAAPKVLDLSSKIIMPDPAKQKPKPQVDVQALAKSLKPNISGR